MIKMKAVGVEIGTFRIEMKPGKCGFFGADSTACMLTPREYNEKLACVQAEIHIVLLEVKLPAPDIDKVECVAYDTPLVQISRPEHTLTANNKVRQRRTCNI